jgi:hypothetical protein
VNDPARGVCKEQRRVRGAEPQIASAKSLPEKRRCKFDPKQNDEPSDGFADADEFK